MATIRKRGLRWQAQIRRHGHPPLAKTFLTKDDALRWSRSQERRIDLGEMITLSQTSHDLKTLSDLIARYQKEVSVLKRSKSDEFHFRQVNRHPVAKLTVASLTATAIAGFRDHRLKSVSGSTVRKELTLLGHVLTIAKNEWGVQPPSDPVGAVRKPKSASGRDRRVTPEQIASILGSLQQTKNPIVKRVFLFALATGMRRGEVLSLTWDHVDLEKRTAFLTTTKNGEARQVPLSPAALALLAETQGAAQRAPEGTVDPSCGPVFPITANAFRLSWERVKRRAGVEGLRFHDLRHEAISRFFEMGLSLPEVSLISGHKDPRMLLRYTHLKAESVAKRLLQGG